MSSREKLSEWKSDMFHNSEFLWEEGQNLAILLLHFLAVNNTKSLRSWFIKRTKSHCTFSNPSSSLPAAQALLGFRVACWVKTAPGSLFGDRDKSKLPGVAYCSSRCGENASVQNFAAKLTELVTDALILQQRRVIEGVPAIQDPRVPAQRGNAAQRQHRVVYQQRGWLFPQPG